MAKQTLNNGETGAVIRAKINDNFTEVYTTIVDQDTTLTTLTPVAGTDTFDITALNGALTIANPSTDYPNGEGFQVMIKDDGTARGLSFGGDYVAVGQALPTTTTLGKMMIISTLYNSTANKYYVQYTEEL